MGTSHNHTVLAFLLAATAHLAPCQGCLIRGNPLVTATPSAQMPAYEVTTVKPVDPNGFGPPLRAYIQEAFGIPQNVVGWVIGPEWINSARYVMNGKPPDSLRTATQSMTNAEQQKQTELMMQSLLADRFQFKAHHETREMPVYELVQVKGGSKLKESSNPANRRIGTNNVSLRGSSPLQMLIDALECTPDLGHRKIIDKTGLTGTYDYLLKWSPLQTASSSGNSAAPTPSTDPEDPPLFTALEDQLGLKLVPSKSPGEVLVIDHIEQPSPN